MLSLHLEETEFGRRMDHVLERIREHRSEPSEQITVEYLFYGSQDAFYKLFFMIIKIEGLIET